MDKVEKTSSIANEIVKAEEEVSQRSTGMSLKDNRNIAYLILGMPVLIGLIIIIIMAFMCPNTSNPLINLGLFQINWCY